MTNNLKIIYNKLKELNKKLRQKNYVYYIPSLWISWQNNENRKIRVNPFKYFIDAIDELEKIKSELNTNSENIYNLFIRFACSFDHINEGKISLELSGDNPFKSTGTFLKAIALLPYIKSLGVDTISLLPINSIGLENRKGTLGSPFAVRNPYKLDENLSEDILEIDIEIQYKAFVEACHLIGIKVIQEFTIRTASVDSELTLLHPNWFYWIKSIVQLRAMGSDSNSKFGSPMFKKREIHRIKEGIALLKYNDLPVPDQKYKSMFTDTPVKTARVENKIYGMLNQDKSQNKKTNECVIPSGFDEWNIDINQKLWEDTTYYKLYDSNQFNYMAYNTLRYYSDDIKRIENIPNDLWEYLSMIVPHHIKKFNIDGAVIDKGHLLPMELRRNIINQIKQIRTNFIIWDKNSEPTDLAKQEGYNACMGYLSQEQHNQEKLKYFINNMIKKEFPLDLILSSENYNTPRSIERANDIEYLKLTYLINRILPMPSMIHNGFELIEKLPISEIDKNVDTSNAEIEYNNLPLYSNIDLVWESKITLIPFIKEVNKLTINNNIKGELSSYLEDERFLSFSIISERKFGIIASFNQININRPKDIKEVIYKSSKAKINDSRISLDNYGFLILELGD